jgi:hypothetical protein
MSRIKPYQGTSHARLSQLIRSAQNPPLPSGVSFEFGVPEVGGRPVPGATKITLQAKVRARVDPQTTVHYKRLGLDVLNKLPDGELVPFDPIIFPTTMHAILPQVNAGLGLDLSADEVDDMLLPAIPVNGLTIKINSKSLAWLAGEYFFPYAPHADQPAGRGVSGAIPTDERRRIRVLELPQEPTV